MMFDKIKPLLEKQPKNLFSIGDSMVCLLPEKNPSIRYSDTLFRKPAGAEINTLIGLARLGLSTSFLTELANDSLGRFLEHYLLGEKIRLHAPETNKPTPLFIKETEPDGFVNVTYYRKQTAGSDLTFASIENTLSEIKTDAFLYSGIFPALSETNAKTLQSVLEAPATKNTLKIFDPNIRFKLFNRSEDIIPFMKKWIQYCDILLIGDKEAEFLFQTENPEELFKIVQKLGVNHLVIKAGEKGSIIFNKGQQFKIPIVKTPIITDTTGAGDAFNAGYIFGVLSELSPEESGFLGSLLASQIITSTSDNEKYPYLEELEELFKRTSSAHSRESSR